MILHTFRIDTSLKERSERTAPLNAVCTRSAHSEWPAHRSTPPPAPPLALQQTRETLCGPLRKKFGDPCTTGKSLEVERSAEQNNPFVDVASGRGTLGRALFFTGSWHSQIRILQINGYWKWFCCSESIFNEVVLFWSELCCNALKIYD